MEQEEQELIYKLSIYEQQMQQIQQQLEVVEKTIVDISSLNSDLDELKGKTGQEIFAPVGRGIFAKAKLLSEDLIVNVGEGNLITKNIPETKAIIEKQIEKLKEVRKELEVNTERISHELEGLMKEAEEKRQKE
ncbi:MAG TPA: prefoldin subunit alpha [Patescibacteria group bacterium]|nr:prefoldin subunit alpha [Patescibacteria group bacterium]